MTQNRSGVDTLTRRAAGNCNVYCKPEQGIHGALWQTNAPLTIEDVRARYEGAAAYLSGLALLAVEPSEYGKGWLVIYRTTSLGFWHGDQLESEIPLCVNSLTEKEEK